MVDRALEDLGSADISDGLRATLGFLEKLTLLPASIDDDDVATVMAANVSPQALRDAIEVAAAFNTITRLADALDFAPQSPESLAMSAERLATRGYA